MGKFEPRCNDFFLKSDFEGKFEPFGGWSLVIVAYNSFWK